MKTASYLLTETTFEKTYSVDSPDEENIQLVLGFGDVVLLTDPKVYLQVKEKFPNATIALCSTAGEIHGNEVLENSLSITAIEFEKTPIESSSISIDDYKNSFDAGAALITKCELKDLKHVFILSDGGSVNGSELVRGIESVIQSKVPVTGGLAGDSVRFEKTLVGLNEPPSSGNIIAICLYGDAIQISHGSVGGWEMFGLEKVVTKSTSNELFEIDNECALSIYKKYLGKYADELPSSALLFPLSVQLQESKEPVVRTILSVNNERQSMIFAGDVPEGARVRFMKANFDKLIDAASDAALLSIANNETRKPKLAILISCVGRKLILDKRVEEEVEAVRDILGEEAVISGFYSYGEISPLIKNTKCELHNQTMTITTFDEI